MSVQACVHMCVMGIGGDVMCGHVSMHIHLEHMHSTSTCFVATCVCASIWY